MFIVELVLHNIKLSLLFCIDTIEFSISNNIWWYNNITGWETLILKAIKLSRDDTDFFFGNNFNS